MKSDSNGVSQCPRGQESFEKFKALSKTFYQYDYRADDGTLFSCCKSSLELCRQERDKYFEARKTRNIKARIKNVTGDPSNDHLLRELYRSGVKEGEIIVGTYFQLNKAVEFTSNGVDCVAWIGETCEEVFVTNT